MKLDNKMNLLELYIEFELFEDAIKLYNVLSKKEIIEPEMVFIPYAAYLMRENRYEEALENYKKIEKLDLCIKMLKKFISINLMTKNYLLVASFQYELRKLKNRDY